MKCKSFYLEKRNIFIKVNSCYASGIDEKTFIFHSTYNCTSGKKWFYCVLEPNRFHLFENNVRFHSAKIQSSNQNLAEWLPKTFLK